MPTCTVYLAAPVRDMKDWEAVNRRADAVAAQFPQARLNGAGTGLGVRDVDWDIPRESARAFVDALKTGFRDWHESCSVTSDPDLD